MKVLNFVQTFAFAMKFSRFIGFDTKKYNVRLCEKKIAVETWRVTNERNSLKCGWQENNTRVRVLKSIQ